MDMSHDMFDQLMDQINQDAFYTRFGIGWEAFNQCKQWLQHVENPHNDEWILTNLIVMVINKQISQSLYWANAKLTVCDGFPWVSMSVSSRNTPMQSLPINALQSYDRVSLKLVDQYIRKSFQMVDNLDKNCNIINQIIGNNHALEPFTFQKLNPAHVVNNPFFYSLDYLGNVKDYPTISAICANLNNHGNMSLLVDGGEMVLAEGYEPVHAVLLPNDPVLRSASLNNCDPSKTTWVCNQWFEIARGLIQKTHKKISLRRGLT